MRTVVVGSGVVRTPLARHPPGVEWGTQMLRRSIVPALGAMVARTPRGVPALLQLALAAALFGGLATAGSAAVPTRGTGAHARFACSTTWTNAAGGLWSDGANWSNGVPTAGSQVCITTAGTY